MRISDWSSDVCSSDLIERSSDIHAQYACDAAERSAAISRIVESPEVLVHVKGCEVAIARADASKHLAAASVDAREVRADLVQQIATDFRNLDLQIDLQQRCREQAAHAFRVFADKGNRK